MVLERFLFQANRRVAINIILVKSGKRKDKHTTMYLSKSSVIFTSEVMLKAQAKFMAFMACTP